MVVDQVDIVGEQSETAPEEEAVDPPPHSIPVLLFIMQTVLSKGTSSYSTSYSPSLRCRSGGVLGSDCFCCWSFCDGGVGLLVEKGYLGMLVGFWRRRRMVLCSIMILINIKCRINQIFFNIISHMRIWLNQIDGTSQQVSVSSLEQLLQLV